MVLSRFKRLKRFWRYAYSPRVLIKSTGLYLGLLIASLVVGFVLPNTKLYDLFDRSIHMELLPQWFAILILIVMCGLDLMIIRAFLVSKYALNSQANLASVFSFIVLSIFSCVGFWQRVNLEYATPAVVDYYEIANHVSLSLVPWYLPVVLTIAATFSLVSVVFGLALGSYSSVDYTALNYWLIKFFGTIDEIEKRLSVEPPDSLHDLNDGRLTRYVDEAIVALERAIPYETGEYANFVKISLLEPLHNIKKFLETNEVKMAIENILLLTSNDNNTVNWLDDNMRKSFQDFSYLFRGK